ncbi:restriction endonuclease [Mitsuaria sp. GD03876]|uniref:nSTAND3 domain-containing NTPase n=1 Tax=Mitsuaria sp. GD03876 TaxID=2975399 RepID=UPI002447C0FF|nr:restriction endonuclease [Mitsuaria sp. GD03876]MDH0863902.1 restriction endonuclease [Mitsuaria sp. GD03876]
MSYDFMTLSPQDFERLVGDLLGKELGVPLQQFKAGPDGGVDLQFALSGTGQGDWIVQCKRYGSKDFAALRRSLVAELPKLERLRPSRYLVATSVGLTPDNKREVGELLRPWVISSNDVFGADDLNRLLRAHPAIEQAHLKLWLSSTAVLERVLNAAIFARTEASLEDTARMVGRLVVHGGVREALDALRQRHHVMIVGNPGVGKTTLARLLQLEYLREGFQPLWVSGHIEEAWAIVQAAAGKDAKFVIVYDDFLGRLGFDNLRFHKNEETSLLRFVDLVSRRANLRFILTTREYILEDAKRLHGAFDEGVADFLKYTLSIEDYTRPERARILFNHLYFSDLAASRLEALVTSQAYRTVLDGDFFNPRMVETVCKAGNSQSLEDDAFLAYFQEEFKNPVSLWRHPFENEIGPLGRSLLLALWSFGGPADLESVTAIVHALHPTLDPLSFQRAMTQALRQLDGNFILTDRLRVLRGGQPIEIVSFQNPSVEEFVEGVARGKAYLRTLAAVVTHVDQAAKILGVIEGSGADPALLATLRQRAVDCDGRRNGLLRHLSDWANESPERYWDERGSLTDIAVLRLLLDIDLRCEEDDDEASDLIWRRILAVSRWEELMALAWTDHGRATEIGDLVEWLVDSGHGRAQPALAMFREAVRRSLHAPEAAEYRARGVMPLVFAAMHVETLSPEDQARVLAVVEDVVTQSLEYEGEDPLSDDWHELTRFTDAYPSFTGLDALRTRLNERINELESMRHEADDGHGGYDGDPGDGFPPLDEPPFDEAALFRSLLDR